nr:hypothetical protein [Spirochaeta sp.]
RVIWSNREYRVTSVQRTGESTARDRGGSSERYRDRHYFVLTLEGGPLLEAYFERRARDPRRRWWARVIEDTAD